MNHNILIAGFGGQGVILVGQLLGYAAIEAGKNATFYPSYGPEQRGGTANCSVVISDNEIGSPVVTRPNVLVCFNNTALEKFLPTLQSDGLLLVNRSQVAETQVLRTDIRVVGIEINAIAEQLGSAKVANSVMLGAIIQKTGAIPLDIAEAVMLRKMSRKPQFLEMNRQAFQQGAQAV